MASNGIEVDDYSFAAFQVILTFGDTELSTATAFFYRQLSTLHLVTNWHVVAGRNSETGSLLDKKNAGTPNHITVRLPGSGPGRYADMKVSLYQDDRQLQPAWMVHPKFGRHIDVAVLRVGMPTSGRVFPINQLHNTPEMNERISEDAYVLGFPMGLTGGVQLPIWKRASIATEPQVNWNGLPALLVDTATRKGMSGAPVIVRANSGSYRTADGGASIDIMGPGLAAPTKFLGVYSGRDSGDELQAQLGIVWKARVIDEIIAGQRLGLVNDYE
jgi:hypothetical protein